MTNANFSAAVDALEAARLGRTTIEPLKTTLMPDIDLQSAYQISFELCQRALARGEKLIGYKMGLTSKAKREQMGLECSIFSWLVASMQIGPGQAFKKSLCTQAKAEAEIVFRLGRDVEGALTRAQAAEVIDGVAVGIEFIDSRYRNFKYFSLPDVVADAASGAYFAVGDFANPKSIKSLGALKMKFSSHQEILAQADSSEISGHPLDSLVELSQLCAQHGRKLLKGHIVLAGSATPAIQVAELRDLTLDVDELPQLKLSVL
jgi:2-oxo-3-hexenedioate decarboxylase